MAVVGGAAAAVPAFVAAKRITGVRARIIATPASTACEPPVRQ